MQQFCRPIGRDLVCYIFFKLSQCDVPLVMFLFWIKYEFCTLLSAVHVFFLIAAFCIFSIFNCIFYQIYLHIYVHILMFLLHIIHSPTDYQISSSSVQFLSCYMHTDRQWFQKVLQECEQNKKRSASNSFYIKYGWYHPAPAHIMKALRGEWRCSSTHVNFSTRLRCVVRLLLQLLYVLGKNPCTQRIGERWAPKTVWMFWIRKNHLSPPRLQPWIVHFIS